MIDWEQRLRDTILAPHAQHVLAHARRSIHLARRRQTITRLPLGGSRMGGWPDLPPEFAWPTHNGKPLAFLAQFDLAAIPNSGALPSAGSLVLFCDVESTPWGFDPAHRSGSTIAYFGPEIPLRQTRNAGSREFECHAVRFESAVDLPYPEDIAFAEVFARWSADEQDEYMVLLDELDVASQHHLLGHAQIMQNDMHLEAQLASNGVFCGDASGYKSPRGKELAAGARDWQLLLQLSSDGSLEWMWGDAGRLYFWLRDDDVRARRFDRSWLILQCG